MSSRDSRGPGPAFPVKATFWKHVEFEPNTGCWLWTGFLDHHGYAKYRDSRFSTRKGHRISYECHVGQIEDGLTIDHLCRQRSCVNPKHLETVSMSVNVRRGAHARTHCNNGHVITPENIVRGTISKCLECRRNGNRRHKKRWEQRQKPQGTQLKLL